MERPNKNTVIILALIVFVFAGMQACYYDVEEELYPEGLSNCDTTAVTYTSTINAITASSCAVTGCHTGVAPAAGLFLNTYQQVKSIADDGRLLQKVIIERSMPPAGPLPDCERAAIEDWIIAGAPE